MRAYKCDRCGVLYEPFEQTLQCRRKGLHGDFENVDLCVDCYDELFEFLQGVAIARIKNEKTNSND